MASSQKFGRYEIRSVIGTGSMSIVYEGYDGGLQRPAAIKTVRKDLLDSDESNEIRERFRQEARIIASLKHPNFIGVYEYMEDWDPPYIAMELISARNLAEHARDDFPFSRDQVGQIGLDILDALHYLHAQGYVHRDIKPANLFWTEGHPLKVADLGVAHVATSTLTMVGTMVGTPAYMAPEQFEGTPTDGRIDLWATGVVLFELLTRTRCFKGDQNTVRKAILGTDPFDSPIAMERIVGTAFEPVLRRALEKNRDTRYSEAAEFRQAWHDAINQKDANLVIDSSAITRHGANFVKASAAVVQSPNEGANGDATVITMQKTSTAAEEAPPSKPARRKFSNKILISAVSAVLFSGAIYFGTVILNTAPKAERPVSLSAEVSRILQTVQCSDLTVQENGLSYDVRGFVPNNEVAAELRSHLVNLAGQDHVTMTVEVRPWPFCDAMQALKPALKGRTSVANGKYVKVPNYVGKLVDGDELMLEIAAPEFDAYIYVDYIQGDQTVKHLYASRGSNVTRKNTNVTLPVGSVESPFGDEMIIYIASPVPLFLKTRPESEPVETYLADIRSNIDAATVGSLVADYFFIKTVKSKVEH